jgi:hypothetical protein
MDQAKRAGHWSEEACEGYRPFKPLVLGPQHSRMIFESQRAHKCSGQWVVDS